ncbi:PQQ-dependent sugar dehydrogenase [Saccharothrix obliqua]|uniref:PQQ-dependent sugar dehydrogenase n=1 Tax=Saccharothrix obliqua TaxID=2861747 RepID=UPI001C5D9F0F|nr:PQQ-dependent sugar dehydrogenase [Saccharothrix obliqua]MBW4719063.1 PQQ-dependent sugar dehydrogenase [Saccharothrix obliqua]
MGLSRRRPAPDRLTTRATVLLITAGALVALPPTVHAAVPPGFTDTVAIGGLTAPTAAAFAPGGKVFIAEKSGLVKVYDSLADTTPTVFADLRPQTQDFWDRGLLGLAVDPAFPARPYVYVAYTHDAAPGGSAPRWGDTCPTPPGATDRGCVVTGRVSRLTSGPGGTATAELPLVTDWCQQYPSHSTGTVAFGPDGALYVGGGDGASFNFADYGQVGNPCADPPGPAGTDLTPPTARGGALRSQSVRRPAGERVTLNGSIARIDPDTGAALPDNPFAGHPDPNARRIIAHGLRNPFRFAFRPGTEELWVGDVGWDAWEEINRVVDVNDTAAENFGWPCFEGPDRQPGYDGAGLALCGSLNAADHTAPFHAYHHTASVTPGDPCPVGGSSIAGIAFEGTGNYPPAYDGALFFADSSRGCVWAVQTTGGQPDPTKVVPFVTGANVPVQLLTGPGGDLFYVALGAGQLRRVGYPSGGNRAPTATATATPASGPAPLAVRLSAAGSTDPDGDALSYAWDLDGDGAYDDSTSATPTRTYLSTTAVGLRVTDPAGAAGTASVVVTVTGQDPVPVIDDPTAALRWQVGQVVPFAGHATDPQDGPLPPSALRWRLSIQHCATTGSCHEHVVQDSTGASGTFVAPDHEYPSHLELTLTATDSGGRAVSTRVRLDPRTVTLNFASDPGGALLSVGGTTQRTPFSRTVIVGSNNSVSAPSPQDLPPLNLRHRFRSWSDGGAQAHNTTAPGGTATLTATYTFCLLTC